MKSTPKKVKAIRVDSHAAVVVKAAVLFDREGFMHSAMLSRCSLWSAGQRIHRSKKKLTSEAIQLHISFPMLREMYKAAVKQHRRNMKKWRLFDAFNPPDRGMSKL